jgi:hypothetical protein
MPGRRGWTWPKTENLAPKPKSGGDDRSEVDNSNERQWAAYVRRAVALTGQYAFPRAAHSSVGLKKPFIRIATGKTAFFRVALEIIVLH